MNINTFLSDFILVSDWKTIACGIFFVGCVFLLIWMGKKKVSFTVRMVVSTLLGLSIGVIGQVVAGFPSAPEEIPWMRESISWLGLLGNGFIDLLKMLIIPIVFFSIIRVIMRTKEEGLGIVALKTVAMLIGTTAVAAITGILIGNIFQLGTNMVKPENATTEMKNVGSIIDTLKSLIPSNPIADMANLSIIAVVIFAAFIGTAIRLLHKTKQDEVSVVVKFVEACYQIITTIASMVFMLMPYAVVALFANTVLSRGISSLMTVLDFVIAIYVAILCMFIIHLIIVALNGLNPIVYIKKVAEPLLLAFTSRSSIGTLPVTIRTLTDHIGVEEGLATFTSSLGSNMGMNACAGIYPALVAVTIANMVGIEKNMSFYIMLIIVVAIGSIGIAGLPGVATIALSLTLSGMGLDAYFYLIGGIIAIDPILDMGRTLLNVNGTLVTGVTIANLQKKLDKSIFRKKV